MQIVLQLRRMASAAVVGIVDSAVAERPRWILWTPVALAVGIGIYFALVAEPPAWIGVLLGVLAAGAAFVGRQNPRIMLPAIGLFVVLGGFTLAQWRTIGASHVVLERTIGPSTVTGRVDSLQTLPDGARLVLDRVRIAGLEPPATPERIRLRLRGEQPPFAPGAWIQARARIAPPPPPAMPGSYDFQFLFYFQEIGGTGFAYGRARLLSDAIEQATLAQRWQGFRQRLTERIRATIGGPAGAVAAALITGDRSAIPENVLEAFRDSGIAHLLAISGLHIGLVAGLLFAGIRAVLALVPRIALNYPIKKWAAVAAIAGALFYTLLAGATVPTQRSFLMMGLLLFAVIVDRQGVSMRFVAIAAFLILAIQPEVLLSASFQMSFAAVVALIAAYEAWGRGLAARTRSNILRRIALYVAGVALTTVIASLATAPFVVFHFNRVALYGLLGNLIAVPLSSILVMPAAILGMILMPFGLEDIGLRPMGWGIDVILHATDAIAALDAAVITLPAMPPAALVITVLGGLWLCLWRRSWRLAGLAGAIAGVIMATRAAPPDILADGEAKLFAVHAESGRFLVSSRTAARFNRETWLRRVGFEPSQEQLWSRISRDEGPGDEPSLRCDAIGCVGRIKTQTVAFSAHRAALGDDCRYAAIVISAVPVPRRTCPSADVLIDRYDLWRNGTHALWIGRDGVRIESVNGARGNRPWVVMPRPAPRATTAEPDVEPETVESETADETDDATSEAP